MSQITVVSLLEETKARRQSWCDKRAGGRGRRLMTLILSLSCAMFARASSIPDNPLQTSTSAEPNIMMILDDSGSMHWEAMPDEVVYTYFMFPRASQVYGGNDYTNYTLDSNENNRYVRFLRSHVTNSLYYSPAIYYRPWSNQDGSLFPNADPTAALHNPGRPQAGSRNLTVDNTNTARWLNDNGSFPIEERTYFPATYFIYTGDNVWAAAGYQKIEIKPENAPFPKAAGRTDCAGATCTYNEEIVNFANWYSYYRSRVLTARAGIGRAFAAQGEKMRVGFGAINKGTTAVDGVDTKTIVSGVRLFSGASRNQFFTDLYGHVIPADGTPLRRALDDAGQYYSRTDDTGPWSSTPGVAGGTHYSCRQSYTILMTDGYWNGEQAGTANARQNNDGTDGPEHEITSTTTNSCGVVANTQEYTYSAVSPYTDGRNNTLADIAMYYWKNDINTARENKVPTNSRDPAFWQHMVTFGIGLGLTGSIRPADALAAIDTGVAINWADPSASNAAKLDDLLHASINGHGGFFSAQNPEQFSTALGDVLSDIASRSGSAASIAANSTQLETGTVIFNAKFDSSTWTGELEALPAQNLCGGGWKASSLIPEETVRNVLTRSGGNFVEFKWASLGGTDQTTIGSEDIVNYIRGRSSLEKRNNGTFRNRITLLGDVVHSSPFYVSDTNTVYIGANDGMLHAFNASTGIESFAYIPSSIFAKLNELTLPSYSHKYFVDGDIAVSTRAQTPEHNYLVATLGRGGKGLFGLNVSDPATMTSSGSSWEYFSTTDADLGYMLGRPVIAKMNNGVTAVIVGNGYNSTDGKAVLYIFNLATGALIRKIDTEVADDNGLASPGVYDSDNDGDIDFIYAGDLKGNVWKIDVTGDTDTTWQFSYYQGTTPKPLFVAKDALNAVQPITAQISVALDNVIGDSHYGKRFLHFGTGAFFRSDDLTDKSIQTWYGLIDEDAIIAGRSVLKERTIVAEGVLNNKNVRAFEASVAGDMENKKGWYLDLKKMDGTPLGERIVTASRVYKFSEPTLLASSIIPVVDPCIPGGTGYLNAVNPFTGGRLSAGFYDVTGNGSFSDDLVGGYPTGSVDLGIGMPSQPVAIGNIIAVGGSSGNVGSIKVNTGSTKTGRLSWREIIKD